MFETWHGRMLLRIGRLSEARAVLDGRFALEDETHAAGVLDAAGIVALGRLAIHTGDNPQTRRLADIARVMLEEGTPAVRRHAGGCSRFLRWLQATPKRHEAGSAHRPNRTGDRSCLASHSTLPTK